jgi:hypothetical protein
MRIRYMTLLLSALGLASCQKETSIEHSTRLAADMVATIGGTAWQAAQGSPSAIFSHGLATISGISADGQEISITLDDTIPGLYTLDQTSGSLAIYADLDSVGGYAFSTNQGADTSQAGGTVDVLSVDPAQKIISGIFSFKLYRDADSSQRVITAGVFYDIPYTDQ